MQRRSVLFVILNIFLSIGVALGAIALFGERLTGSQQAGQVVVTVPLLITTTPGPTQTPWLITATPEPGTVILPPGLITPNPRVTQQGTSPDSQSVNPAQETPGAQTASGTQLPANCIIHVVESGDTPFGLGEIYGVSGFELMEVNGLSEETATNLQLVQELIIPLEGCTLTVEDIATATPTDEPTETSGTGDEETPEATSDATALPSPTPTVTLAPTAANAAVTITNIISAGDVTAEGVEIRNDGALVDLTGWTLTDAEGNVFTFPEQRLFTGGLVTVYTRVGANTSIALFWNRNTAVWGTNDVATLRDEDGVVQSTFRVQNARSLP
ncbi:MAG: lamin tail domain-containing protein [Anaerolineae bacterium]